MNWDTEAAPVTASVCGNLNNFIGMDGVGGKCCRNVNTFRSESGLQGVFLSSEGVDPETERYGTLALATAARGELTYRTGWFDGGLHVESLADYWNEFSRSGTVTSRDDGGIDHPMASLAVKTSVPASSEQTLCFLITWCFPNRFTWTPEEVTGQEYSSYSHNLDFHYTRADRVGNYYAVRFPDAWQAALYASQNMETLERRTLEFVSNFCDSDLPASVKEAALYNLSSLRSQTCFRTEDGNFYGWEGCRDQRGCCFGSCTHVWNYEQSTPFLFGDIAKKMREVEFRHMTRENGHMSFRVFLPLDKAREFGLAAADGQMGCLMKLYRDWMLSGDDTIYLHKWCI